MAVTSIWPIKGRVKAVIDYANDPSKVKASSQAEQAALHAVNGVLEYAADDLKTELRVYAHGINCNLRKAAEDFMSTKRFWQKTGGRTAYHGYQSFQAGEVTAEQAHEIGMELARRLWGERFEVVVALKRTTNSSVSCQIRFVGNTVCLLSTGPGERRWTMGNGRRSRQTGPPAAV